MTNQEKPIEIEGIYIKPSRIMCFDYKDLWEKEDCSAKCIVIVIVTEEGKEIEGKKHYLTYEDCEKRIQEITEKYMYEKNNSRTKTITFEDFSSQCFKYDTENEICL